MQRRAMGKDDGRCPNCGEQATPGDHPYWYCEDCYQDGFYEDEDPFDGTLWEKIDGEDVGDE